MIYAPLIKENLISLAKYYFEFISQNIPKHRSHMVEEGEEAGLNRAFVWCCYRPWVTIFVVLFVSIDHVNV